MSYEELSLIQFHKPMRLVTLLLQEPPAKFWVTGLHCLMPAGCTKSESLATLVLQLGALLAERTVG